MQHIMAIDAIIVEDMKTNEYFVQFSVYFQRVSPSEKVEIVSTLYFNCPLKNSFLFQNTGANPLILLEGVYTSVTF